MKIEKLDLMTDEKLMEVINTSGMDYDLHVIVERKGKKFKFFFIQDGCYWCSIDNLKINTFEIITECYRKARILQALYFDIHCTFDQLNNMVPNDMLDETFQIKNICKKINCLDLVIDSTNNYERNTVIYCESEKLVDKKESLCEILKEFGNYTIVSSQKIFSKDNTEFVELTTNLPYNLYLMAYGHYFESIEQL